jgi:hypothetical protein
MLILEIAPSIILAVLVSCFFEQILYSGLLLIAVLIVLGIAGPRGGLSRAAVLAVYYGVSALLQYDHERRLEQENERRRLGNQSALDE